MNEAAAHIRALAAAGELGEAGQCLAEQLATLTLTGPARLPWAALAEEIGALELANEQLRAAAREAPTDAAVAAELAVFQADLGPTRPVAGPSGSAGSEEGDFEAQRSPGLGAQIDASQPDLVPPTPADIARFLHLFSGREGVHARQWVDEAAPIASRRHGYGPQASPLTPRLIEAHLAGTTTLGVYPIRLDGTVTFFVLDLDLTRRALEAGAQHQATHHRHRGELSETALGIQAGLAELGLPTLLVDSGHKGRHLWGLLAAPQPADLLHRFGRLLLRHLAPSLPPALSLEFFPKQPRVEADGLGNLIKLPLGIHRLSGRRATLLDQRGRPFPDPWPVLEAAPRIEPAALLDVFARLRDEVGEGAAPAPPALGSAAPEILEDAPVRAILGGCIVLATLTEQARRTRRLSHDERVVLIHSLGHHAAGVRLIEALFRLCPEVPLRDIPQKPQRGHPISCARIRARVAHLTAQLPCHCAFPPQGADYPSPLLHTP